MPSVESVAAATRTVIRQSMSTSCSGEKDVVFPSSLPSSPPPLPGATTVGVSVL